MSKDSVDSKLITVKCEDCDFEYQVDDGTYALNILQLHKNQTGHFKNYIKTLGQNTR